MRTPLAMLAVSVIACSRDLAAGGPTGDVRRATSAPQATFATFDPSDPAQAYVVEKVASYFGAADRRLTVRSVEASAELIESPQDGTAAMPGAPVGRFRAPLSAETRAALGDLLPALLSPAAPSGPAAGPPPIMDAPTWGVTVARGGAPPVGLRPPAAQPPSAALLQLLADVHAEARKHPVEAVALTVRRDGDAFVWDLASVGVAPVVVRHPLSPGATSGTGSALVVLAWTDPPPNTTGLPATRTPVPWRDPPLPAVSLVTLRPGEHLTLHSAAWKPTAPLAAGAHRAIEATWSDPGDVAPDGVFRVRGYARSVPVELPR